MTNTVLVRNMQFREGKYTCPVTPIPIATVSSTAIKHTIRFTPRQSIPASSSTYPGYANTTSQYKPKSCKNPYAKIGRSKTTDNLSQSYLLTEEDRANAVYFKELMDIIVSNKKKYKDEMSSDSDYEQCSQWFTHTEST